MTPLTDPRPLAEVLQDWLRRHGLTVYAATTHGKHVGPLSASTLAPAQIPDARSAPPASADRAPPDNRPSRPPPG